MDNLVDVPSLQFAGVIAEHVVKKFCDKITGTPIFGRPAFIELARSQRRG